MSRPAILCLHRAQQTTIAKMLSNDSNSGSQSQSHLARLARATRRGAATAAAGIADFIIPPTCLSCRTGLAQHDAVCTTCWRDIGFIRAPLCDRLGLPMPFDTGGTIISAAAAAEPPIYDRARAVAHFAGVMREMILVFKYADTHDARALFGRWLNSAGAGLIADCDVLIPVPMHRKRLRSRRFNQAAILAKEVARTNNKPFQPMLITRIKDTASQAGLSSRHQRRRNLAGAFSVSPRKRKHIEGRRILLIDDVITTGATLNACARTLKRAGAAQVDALALAIVTDDSQIAL